MFWVALWVTFVNNFAPALVVTQTSPPGVLLSGPYRFVTAYTTAESPFTVGPPAASAFTRFVSSPVHTPVPSVSKSLLSCRGAVPLVLIRHTLQVPTSSALLFCGSRIYGVWKAPSSPPRLLEPTTGIKLVSLQAVPDSHFMIET